MKKLLEQLRSNPLYKKYELYIAPAIATLVVLILAFAVIVPNIFQFIEAQNTISNTEEQIDFFQQKEAQLKSIDKESFTRGINSSLIILPGDKEAPGAIAQLYYILGITNMTVENISFSDAGSGSDGKSFKISLELRGSLSSLTNFILQLKEAPRIMRINTLEIRNPTNSSEIQASVAIDAFYEPLPAAISKIDQPIKTPTEKDLEILTKLSTSSFPTEAGSSSQNFTGPKGKVNPFE